MAESFEHRELVLKLTEWIEENLLDGDKAFLFADIDRRSNSFKTIKVLNGYQPDVFVKIPNKQVMIIGEAKTSKDIDREHSINQYKSYFDTCKICEGLCYLIFAVQFSHKPRIKNVLNNNNIKEKTNIKIIVLEF